MDIVSAQLRLRQLVAITLIAVTAVGCASVDVKPAAPSVAPAPKVTLAISQTDRGVLFVLPDTVLFESGKSALDESKSGDYLDRLAELVTKKSDKTLLVEGHTDNVGSASSNLRLSELRAQSVAQALARRGVPTMRLTEAGHSLSKPIAPNDLDSGRRLNRRVEVTVLGERVETFTKGEHASAFEDAAEQVKRALESKGK